MSRHRVILERQRAAKRLDGWKRVAPTEGRVARREELAEFALLAHGVPGEHGARQQRRRPDGEKQAAFHPPTFYGRAAGWMELAV